MDVTPKLLEDVEFREKFRGYDPEEVDDFLERVAVAFSQLQEKLRDATDQIESANARAARAEARARDSSDTDDTLRRTLVLAQRTADAAIKEAEENAAAIVAAAEAQARQHYAAAEERAAQTAAQADAAAQEKVTEAEGQAAEKLRLADSQGEATLANAREQASRLLVDARQKADRLVVEAESTAVRQAEEKLARLTEEVNGLERRRDALAHDVNALDAHTTVNRERLAVVLAQLQGLVNEPAGLGELGLPTLTSISFDDAIAAHVARAAQPAPADAGTGPSAATAPLGATTSDDAADRSPAEAPSTGTSTAAANEPAGESGSDRQASPLRRVTDTAGEPGTTNPLSAPVGSSTSPFAPADQPAVSTGTGLRTDAASPATPAAPVASVFEAARPPAPSTSATGAPSGGGLDTGRVSRDPVGRDDEAPAPVGVFASASAEHASVGPDTEETPVVDLDAGDTVVDLADTATTVTAATTAAGADAIENAETAGSSGTTSRQGTFGAFQPGSAADTAVAAASSVTEPAGAPSETVTSRLTDAASTIPPLARRAEDRPSIGLGVAREAAAEPAPSAAPPWMGMAPPPPPPPPPAARAEGATALVEPGEVPPPPPPAPTTAETAAPSRDTFLDELRRAVGEEPENDEAIRFFEDRDPTDPALRFFEGTEETRSRFRRR